MDGFPLIRTDKYLLRQFSAFDLENVFIGLSNEQVTKYYGISFQTLEATKEQIKWFAGLESQGTGIWWAICLSSNDQFYGAIGFSSLNKAFRNAEIGFWLHPEYWNQGIISEVFPLICNYGFTDLNLHRIEALVETENTACKNVLKKLNFTNEGTKRECEIKDGKLISLNLFSKLQTD